jgi:hypothetical protein
MKGILSSLAMLPEPMKSNDALVDLLDRKKACRPDWRRSEVYRRASSDKRPAG